MCGIFGIVQRDGKRPVDIHLLQRATNILKHRGPDDEGYLLVNTSEGGAVLCGGSDTDPRLSLPPVNSFAGRDFNLALGFRRLSILDLTPAGHQPMSSADGRCWIVFNGEVYNYIELRAELEANGFAFRSHTDTEVILAAYQQWGVRCLEHFTGMWAFAIWDMNKRMLFLARDPFGIKPLYYAFKDSTFAFASEIKALLQLDWVSRQINPTSLRNYLNSGLADNGPETFFKDVRQVPQAHHMIIQPGKTEVGEPARYWHIDLNQKADISFPQAAQRLREMFLHNVHIHLRSDVPLGSALSGGIDSSSIVSSMRRLQGDKLELHAFSFAADDPAINEERWVDIVGSASKATVHKVRITRDELVADLDRLIYTQDVPFGSTSIYAQHRVFRLAREANIKVMLDGQGADEYLAGYVRYRSSRLASLLRQMKYLESISFCRKAAAAQNQSALRLLAESWAKASPPRNNNSILWRLARKTYHTLPHDMAQFIRRTRQRGLTLPDTVNTRWFTERGAGTAFSATYGGREILKSDLLQSATETSLPALLRYEDRNSMAFSIESRVPFLTTDIVSFVMSLPEEFVMSSDGTTKAVFREAMRGIVPDAILDRRDKIGFQTPEKEWLATLKPWVESVMDSEAAATIPALNLKGIKEHWQMVLGGTVGFDWQIWRWLNLVRWSEQFKVSFD